jgi:hypothetical protein
MNWTYDDGGRAAAGFRGKTGDCGVRAVAIATGRPYADVYDALHNLMKSHGRKGRGASPRTGTTMKAMKAYMASLGWNWVPTMGIGTGCTVHLRPDELPGGRIIVRLSGHYAAVIDGVLHDSFNSAERAPTIYPADYLGNIPDGAKWLENGNGYIYNPERCVYGYWRQA